MRRTALSIIAATAVVLSGPPAWAHHSAAQFDREKAFTLVGTVAKFEWTNPHIWVDVVAMDANGAATQWSIEGGSPMLLSRQGWTRSILKPGDKVSMLVRPSRDGTKVGQMQTLALPDGRQFGSMGTGNTRD